MLHNSYASSSADSARSATGSSAGLNYSNSSSPSYVPPLQPPVNLPAAYGFVNHDSVNRAVGNQLSAAANIPLQDHLQAQVYGDVVVDPSAVLGLGVMLRAETGAKIVIGAGVCVGMGTVLHAQGGEILVGNGVSIGAGGLILGAVKLGDNCCLGTSTTVINSMVASGAVVAPGTVLQQELDAVQETAQATVTETFVLENFTTSSTTESFTTENFITESFITENFTDSTKSVSDHAPDTLDTSVISGGADTVTESVTESGFVQAQITQTQITQTHTQTQVVQSQIEQTSSVATVQGQINQVNHQVNQSINQPVASTGNFSDGASHVSSIGTSHQSVGNAPNETETAMTPDLSQQQPTNAFPIDTEKAKAHAQSQLNRFRNRLFPNSYNPSNF